jgi:hypothetical protein
MRVEHETDTYLEKLERQNNYLRTLLCLGGLVLGCVLFMAQEGAPPNVLTARKFVLVDSRGRTRAELYSQDVGEEIEDSILILHSPNGNTVTLQAGTGIGSLRIEENEALAAIVVDSVRPPFESGASGNITSQVNLKLQAGAEGSNSNVDVIAGPASFKASAIGWRKTINAPMLRLSRETRETIFVTPKPRPLQSSGR